MPTISQKKINKLREKLISAGEDRLQLEKCLDEAGQLLKRTAGADDEQEVRKLLQEIRDRVDIDNNAKEEIENRNATSEVITFHDSDDEVNELMSEARKKYYVGDYYGTIDFLSRVLRSDPNNGEAIRRYEDAENNIKHGIVPDIMIPVDVRIAFGQAQSLERAGRYPEARGLYTQALEKARSGGPLLQNWQLAVDALERISQSIVASDMREEADKFMKMDKWAEAMEKYRTITRISQPDSSETTHAQIMLSDLTTCQEQSQIILDQLDNNNDSLIEYGSTISNLQRSLINLRTKMPQSKKLINIERKLKTRKSTLRKQFWDRINHLILQLEQITTLIGRKSNMEQLTRLLSSGVELWPDDQDLYHVWLDTDTKYKSIESDLKLLQDAELLIASGKEDDCNHARYMLLALKEYVMDHYYRQLVASLRQKYEEFADEAMKKKRLNIAKNLIAVIREVPFNILGNSDDFLLLFFETQVLRNPGNSNARKLYEREIHIREIKLYRNSLVEMKKDRLNRINKMEKLADNLSKFQSIISW